MLQRLTLVDLLLLLIFKGPHIYKSVVMIMETLVSELWDKALYKYSAILHYDLTAILILIVFFGGHKV